jgi:hypothetical protein
MNTDPNIANNSCPAKPVPGNWSWVSQGNGNWGLMSPTGKHAATVYATGAWYVWTPYGDGGQNDVGRDVEDAKWCATHAAKVAWYESGWEVPLHNDDNSKVLNRLVGGLVRVLGGETPREDWGAHGILLEAAPYIRAGKAAVRYAMDLDPEHCGPHERAFLSEVEGLLE